jgi:hypothetical protein
MKWLAGQGQRFACQVREASCRLGGGKMEEAGAEKSECVLSQSTMRGPGRKG